MTRTCPFCNSSEIEEDSSRGDSICTNCGSVLEESTIVSDVQFQERGGGHEVIGQFVSRERAQPGSLSGIAGVSRSESREATYMRGRKRILEIANQLRINQHCIELAYGFFKMCVTKNLTRGRLRSQVVVACLYIACRSESTSHLLLDFSDATQINIFDLGRTLNFLTRSLYIKLPPTDPCIYILRFAGMLEFGDSQRDVVLLATRIVQRMKRDWMSTGRRPTGLCGAALLLAARAFNLNRTVSDIVQVVHISHSVVRKRLDEFANTPSGSLTVDEFSNVDLEENEDPPAYQDSKKRILDAQKRKEEEKAEEATKDFEPIRKEIEAALIKKIKKSPYAKLISNLDDVEDIPELCEADKVIIRDQLIETVYEIANDSDCPQQSNELLEKYGPSPHSLGINQVTRIMNVDVTVPCEDEKNINGELDLTGIDDEEIDTYILTDVEATVKSEYWLARNSEHLIMLEQK